MPIYDKPVHQLMVEMIDELLDTDSATFSRSDAVSWFAEHYPKIKTQTVQANLVMFTTNNNSRVYHRTREGLERDLLYWIAQSRRFRRYNPDTDPLPIAGDARPLPNLKAKLLPLVEIEYPGWTGFDDARFVKDEIQLKNKALDYAAEMLDEESLSGLIESEQFDEFIERLIVAAHNGSTLIYDSTPKTGDVAVLYDETLHRPQLCRQIFSLLYGDGTSPQRVGAFTAYLVSVGVRPKWSFVTYYLFITGPGTELLVKPQSIKRFLAHLDRAEAFSEIPSAESYAALLDIAGDVGSAFDEYGPEDMVDIQSLIWVCALALRKGAPSKSDTERDFLESIFPDTEVGSPGLEILADAIEHANERNPRNWVVSYSKSPKFIRLNVGRAYVLTLYPDSLRVPLVTDALESSTKAEIEQYVKDERFESIPRESTTIRIPGSTIGEIYPRVRAAHLAFVELAANTASGSPYASAHRPSVLDFLDSRLGRRMPRPEYQVDSDVSYWKIAPGSQAKDWDKWREGGYAAIDWPLLGDIASIEHEEFEKRREAAAAQTSASEYTQQGTAQVWRFRDIRVGDYIVANRGTSAVVGIGVVTSGYYYVDGAPNPHRVGVNWFDEPERRVDKPTWLRTLMPLKKDEFRDIVGELELREEYSLEQLASETSFNFHLLQRWVDAIQRKGQAVLYGPPGTGKTFVAERLARHLVSSGDGFSETLQFHPAYAYEDFMQGIRPLTDGNGSLIYDLVPGRFLHFCERARERTGLCVLIIDEINRANLARVFGELMYLLEYRDSSIPLAGSGTFSIPDNVRIIGTMNTADRSIALVDHALRRRFAFLELEPDYDILRAYHARTNPNFPIEALIAVLEQANRLIDDPNYAIGISFFLHDNLADHLEAIWTMEIEPYLVELFFDQPQRRAELVWNKVADRLGL